jgi:hypothetical protein
MNATDFRALLKARHHSSFSASPLIGASPDSIRNWSSGRQKIPSKYLPAIEALPDRSAQRDKPAPSGEERWSPAAAGLPKASIGKRRSKAERRAARPVREISPAAYDAVRPILDPEPEQPAPPVSHFIGQLVQVFEPALALIKRDAPGSRSGLPAVIPAPWLSPRLPAAVPSAPGPALPAGIFYPRYGEMIFGAVFPASLRGRACCAPLMVRHIGGMVAPAFCGKRCEPGEAHCRGHVPRPAVVQHPAGSIALAPMRVKPRRAEYY